ncbi:unnamed protein product, partial [Prorocentrum cordatum]
ASSGRWCATTSAGGAPRSPCRPSSWTTTGARQACRPPRGCCTAWCCWGCWPRRCCWSCPWCGAWGSWARRSCGTPGSRGGGGCCWPARSSGSSTRTPTSRSCSSRRRA